MFNILGAKLSDPEDLKTSLNLKNVLNEPLFVVIDPSHAIKLIRNAIGDLKLLFTGDGRRIDWHHISNLHKLQTSEGLHAANKIKKDHIHYHRKKMRVYLAVQVISDSVADAIEFCESKLQLPGFSDSSGTCEFLRTFNRLFDWTDSKHAFQTGNYKSPMRSNNKEKWVTEFEEAEKFILNLRHTDPCSEPPPKRRDSNLVVKGKRKPGFLGFIINMRTYTQLFELYVEKHKLLDYILGHKLSQDHLGKLSK